MATTNILDPDADDSYSIIERAAGTIRLEDESANLTDRTDTVRDLWEGPRKCQCCINWVDEVPPDVEIEKEEQMEESHPLILRHRILPGEAKKQVSIHSIEIRDAKVREVLLDVFKGLDGIVADIKYLILLAPFRQFFWRWDQFEKAVEDQTDDNVKSILMHLRVIVRADIAEAFVVTKELVNHGVITFKYVWTLFPPGELIYTCQGEDRFLTVRSSSHRLDHPPRFEVTSCFIDWNGLDFEVVTRKDFITPFKGTRKITQLRVFPAKYIENFESVRQTCIDRGRKFHRLAGVHYKSYQSYESVVTAGTTESRVSSSSHSKYDRRIILDARGRRPNTTLIPIGPNWIHHGQRTGLIVQAPLDAMPPGGHRPLVPTEPPHRRQFGGHNNDGIPIPLLPRPPGWQSYHNDDDDRLLPPPRPLRCSSDSTSSDVSESVYGDKRQKLSDDELLLCNSRMLGFCMKKKVWKAFDVTRITDITWNNEPFESLVLPDGYKDLILSFVENQLRDGDSFDDVINGKGGGLVVLLAGDPGVGKTLTAESVAEKMHAPLYKMELGQLEQGDEVDSGKDDNTDEDDTDTRRSAEDKITTAFKLASKWKAVLLIDECDMYLEKRSDTSPKRNMIVSRFLQELEYYPSLLFLTTNREKVLDPAIYSRIHLTINYPALDCCSRRQIWCTFLERETSSLTTPELDILSKAELNGRRIRNIVKTARIIANQQKRPISFNDVKSVLRITEGYEIDEIRT